MLDSQNSGNILSIEDSLIVGNEAEGEGGGVFVQTNGANQISIVNSAIDSNEANNGGGAFFYTQYTSIEIEDAQFRGNRARGEADGKPDTLPSSDTYSVAGVEKARWGRERIMRTVGIAAGR